MLWRQLLALRRRVLRRELQEVGHITQTVLCRELLARRRRVLRRELQARRWRQPRRELLHARGRATVRRELQKALGMLRRELPKPLRTLQAW